MGTLEHIQGVLTPRRTSGWLMGKKGSDSPPHHNLKPTGSTQGPSKKQRSRSFRALGSLSPILWQKDTFHPSLPDTSDACLLLHPNRTYCSHSLAPSYVFQNDAEFTIIVYNKKYMHVSHTHVTVDERSPISLYSGLH